MRNKKFKGRDFSATFAASFAHFAVKALDRKGRRELRKGRKESPILDGVRLELLLPMTQTDEIIERERRFLLPTYNRYPIAMTRGKGVFLYDCEGNRYLDFVAGLGVNALGHAHPRVVKVIREQAARAIHFSNLYYNEYQGRLAEKLCQLSGLNRAFFSNSGTEAIEGSIKLARLAGRRLVSRSNFRRPVTHRAG